MDIKKTYIETLEQEDIIAMNAIIDILNGRQLVAKQFATMVSVLLAMIVQQEEKRQAFILDFCIERLKEEYLKIKQGMHDKQ